MCVVYRLSAALVTCSLLSRRLVCAIGRLLAALMTGNQLSGVYDWWSVRCFDDV